MKNNPFSAFREYLPATLTLILLGWGGFTLIVTLTLPTVWPRWLLFGFLFLGITGIAIPITWFLNLRFRSEPPAGPGVVVRQAMWIGVYVATLAWLQLGRLATFWTFIGLAFGLILVEYLIRMRERSIWRPAPPTPETTQPDTESHEQPPVTPVG